MFTCVLNIVVYYSIKYEKLSPFFRSTLLESTRTTIFRKY